METNDEIRLNALDEKTSLLSQSPKTEADATTTSSSRVKLAIALLASLAVVGLMTYVVTPTTQLSVMMTDLSAENLFDGGKTSDIKSKEVKCFGNKITNMKGLYSSCADNSAMKSVSYSYRTDRRCFGWWGCSETKFMKASGLCNGVTDFAGSSPKITTYYTRLNTAGGINYLDRHNVDCPGNSFLSYLNYIERSGKFRIQYKCTQYNAIRTECEDVNNGFQSIGDNMIYMDRQRVTCPSGKMMTSYKPSTRGKDTTIQSRCCKAQGIFPTMQPTPMPVTNPTFVPTNEPVAIPTEIPITHPTQIPVANPTMQPTMVPVANPTGAPVPHPTEAPTEAPVVMESNQPTKVPVAPPTLAPTLAPVSSPTLDPVAFPTEQPTLAPVSDPTEIPISTPTKAPIAPPTLVPIAVPTSQPNTEPTAAPTTVEPTVAPTEMVYLMCPYEFIQGADYYKTQLKPGCALLSMHDIGNPYIDHFDSPGVLACGTVDLSEQMLETTGIIGLSYMAVAADAQVEYFSEDVFDGSSGIYNPESTGFIHHILDGKRANDMTKSIRVTGNYKGGLTCDNALTGTKAALKHEVINENPSVDAAPEEEKPVVSIPAVIPTYEPTLAPAPNVKEPEPTAVVPDVTQKPIVGEDIAADDNGNLTPFQRLILGYHIRLRSLCSADCKAMAWNGDLSTYAQDYATQLAEENGCGLSHSFEGHNSYQDKSAGENLAMYMESTGVDANTAALKAVNGWAGEGYGADATGRVTGHYTAMMWMDATQVGCGYGINVAKNCAVVACNYANVAPNMIGQYDKEMKCTKPFELDE